MQRLVRAAVLVALLASFAGCGAGPGGGPGTGVEYVVVAEPVDVAPGNAATVNASASALANATAVRDAVSNAAGDDDGTEVLLVSERRYSALNRTLTSIPGVDDRPGDDAVAATLYVTHEGGVYRVTVRKRWLV